MILLLDLPLFTKVLELSVYHKTEIFNFFYFVGHFCPPGSGSAVPIESIRIRSPAFLSHQESESKLVWKCWIWSPRTVCSKHKCALCNPAYTYRHLFFVYLLSG